ncbi:MAG: hypothetical protein ACI9OJ_003880 [Myxococcota bacterium]|jgi:hypothetical protein
MTNKRPFSVTLFGWYLAITSPLALLPSLTSSADLEPALELITEQYPQLSGMLELAQPSQSFDAMTSVIGLICGIGMLAGKDWSRRLYLGTGLAFALASAWTDRPLVDGGQQIFAMLVGMSLLNLAGIAFILYRAPANAFFLNLEPEAIAAKPKLTLRQAFALLCYFWCIAWIVVAATLITFPIPGAMGIWMLALPLVAAGGGQSIGLLFEERVSRNRANGITLVIAAIVCAVQIYLLDQFGGTGLLASITAEPDMPQITLFTSRAITLTSVCFATGLGLLIWDRQTETAA